MKDKGTGAENLIWLASRQTDRAHLSSLAADEVLAGLTARIAELEARVSAILAEVEPEPPRVDSERGRATSAPKADAVGGTDKPNRDTRAEADDELTRASEERRMLANEMRLLREAIYEARGSQPSAGLGANAVDARVAPDPRAAIAEEMRVLLAELFADFRSRAVPPPQVEDVPAKAETIVGVVAAAPTPTVDEVVEDLHTAAPLADSIAGEAVSPIETVESIAEHVDELVRPAPSLVDSVATDAGAIGTSESIVEHIDELVRPTTNPLSDNAVEDLQEPEPPASALLPVDAAQAQPAGFVEDHEEFFRTESPPPIDTVEFEVAPPEPAAPIVDEHVFGAAEPVAPIIDEYVEELRLPEAPPPIQTFDAAPAPAEPIEPIIDEYVEELRRPDAPLPIETFDLGAAGAEPIVNEYVEELRQPEAPPPFETIELSAAPAEPIEPIVESYVDDYVVPPSDVTLTPPVPSSAPDPRLAALWDAVPLPTEPETAPLPEPEPTSFITEDFIAETRPLEIPEEPFPAQELAPEQTIEYVPPPVEFAPPPPIEYAPEPPAIVEPQWEAPAVPPITGPEPARSFSSLYPELTVADERGLHQIQVVISPIHSFPRLLETERRIRALSTVNALHLRDFRNGVATLTVAVSEAISPAEFGAVIQMLENLHLRLEGTTQSTVELHAEDEPPAR